MRSIIFHKRVSKLIAFFLLLGALVPVVSLATHDVQEQHDGMAHTCIFPAIQPDSLSSCAEEAAAYAAAIVTLNDAHSAANEAYRRWYECEYRGKDVKPTVEVPASELSVLVRD